VCWVITLRLVKPFKKQSMQTTSAAREMSIVLVIMATSFFIKLRFILLIFIPFIPASSINLKWAEKIAVWSQLRFKVCTLQGFKVEWRLATSVLFIVQEIRFIISSYQYAMSVDANAPHKPYLILLVIYVLRA
jgi:hypothetical protein